MSAIDLLVTSGSGPVECRIALMALVRTIEEEAGRRGCVAEVTFGHAPDRHGAKSALIGLDGEGSNALAAEYCGSVKFIFKSPVRPGHKRQNWFVGVKRVDMLEASLPEPSIAENDVRFETLRAGGPGGQHQNTTDSAVRAIHLPTGTTVVSRGERSQHRNKAIALRRLAAILRLLADRAEEASKAELFLANKTLERGNAVNVFRL